jgi:hypothetical protein
VAAILDFLWLLKVMQLQGFLRIMNFYPQFLPASAQFSRPLTDSLLQGSHTQEAVKQWSAWMETAFSTTKHAVINT